MSTIKQNSGFTLIEIMIIIAIIGIILAIAFGGASKKAGAAGTPIPDELRSLSVDFMYSTDGYLTIFKPASTGWDSAEVVCNALKPLDPNLKKVTLALPPVSETTTETELLWNTDHTKLSNLDGRYEAVCN